MAHLEDEYTQTVIKEIEQRLARTESPVRLSTLFFGGGTPGLVATSSLDAIVQTLARHVEIASDLEFSLETTPHAITDLKLKEWRALGVNRLSIGIESLQDDELSAIGRDHTRDQALRGLAMAAEYIENINLDFMYGLPTQTLSSWSKTLDELQELCARYPQIKHVSAYSLELAVNSPLLMRFPRNSDAYPEEDAFASYFEALLLSLARSGFDHYEVSNFARPGYACRHNLTYWRNEPYLAFGVGAHRYVDGVRSANFRSLNRYLREFQGEEMHEVIDEGTRLKEGLMLALRMREGIDAISFADRYGIDVFTAYNDQISKLQSLGLIEVEGRRLRISDKGVLLSNSILTEFI